MYTFCMGAPPTPCKCIYSAWAPLPHHVNVYNTSSSSYSSNSNILSSQKCVDLEEICSIDGSSCSHLPLGIDGNSNLDPYVSLKNIRTSIVNRLIVGQLNINSLKSKFKFKHIDILILTETKLDETFLKNQFLIDDHSPPFRQDRNTNVGGSYDLHKEDIPCKMLSKHNITDDLEGICLVLNLRKVKWFLFGGYSPHKGNISNFVCQLGPIVDTYLSTYETSELIMEEFCEM